MRVVVAGLVRGGDIIVSVMVIVRCDCGEMWVVGWLGSMGMKVVWRG